jgi:hypothetical protein
MPSGPVLLRISANLRDLPEIVVASSHICWTGSLSG